jgi:hypothetical protein
MRSAGVVVMAQTDAPFRDGGVKSTPPARGPWPAKQIHQRRGEPPNLNTVTVTVNNLPGLGSYRT